MGYFAGLDVSLEETTICVVDDAGKIVREVRVASEAEALVAFFGACGMTMERVGLEACSLTAWLHAGLTEAGIPAICIEARQAKAAMGAMSNKTDRNDARGLAQIMRAGWYRTVHVKSPPCRSWRALLTAGRMVLNKRRDVENGVRAFLTADYPQVMNVLLFTERNMTVLVPRQPASTPEPRRLLWVVNHRTLMLAEVPILRSLGWEVFVPKVIPDHDPGYRSGSVTYEYDATLALPETALRVLNRQNFYERCWSPTLEDIINRYFVTLVAHFSYYTVVLSEASRKFRGIVVARAFGREHPRTYSQFTERHKDLLTGLSALGDRFIFGQGYDNISDVEPPELRNRAHTITVPLPPELHCHQDIWHGGEAKAVFLCPAIRPNSYYGDIYEAIKRDFGDLPHIIFGRQVTSVDDPVILPYLTDTELLALYAAAAVFVYPHTEPRHVHYSPLEAMAVGTPTLYLRGALIDTLTGGADLPGACSDIGEMRSKAQRLLDGDRALAEAIRATQFRVLDAFSPDLARRQWAAALPGVALSASAIA